MIRVSNQCFWFEYAFGKYDDSLDDCLIVGAYSDLNEWLENI